jgi:hypothetical protein
MPDMNPLPFEILFRIFSLLQFHDKHVVQRVNHHWKRAADHAIEDQRKLIVYTRGSPDARK